MSLQLHCAITQLSIVEALRQDMLIGCGSCHCGSQEFIRPGITQAGLLCPAFSIPGYLQATTPTWGMLSFK